MPKYIFPALLAALVGLLLIGALAVEIGKPFVQVSAVLRSQR